MNALTTQVASTPTRWIDEQRTMLEVAHIVAKSRSVPQWMQNSPGDAYQALTLCRDFGLNFMVASRQISMIKGNAMFGGIIAAAMLHNSGKLATRLTYAFDGEGAERVVTCYATLVGESEPRSVEARWKDAKNEHNDNWRRDPDQQLVYYVTRKWGRRHCPEVMLGARFEGEPVEAAMVDITPGDAPKVTPSVPSERNEYIEGAAAMSAAGEPVSPPVSAETQTDTVKPFALQLDMSSGDSASIWSSWATQLMAYVRAAPDVETINEWTLENSQNLDKLARYDRTKHTRLLDMIKHQIAQRSNEDDAR